MFDALACGQRFRAFNIVDGLNREALHIEVDTSITSARWVRIFKQLHDHYPPQVLRTKRSCFQMYHGLEFLGEAFVQWANVRSMALQYIQSGKPNANSYIELLQVYLPREVLIST